MAFAAGLLQPTTSLGAFDLKVSMAFAAGLLQRADLGPAGRDDDAGFNGLCGRAVATGGNRRPDGRGTGVSMAFAAGLLQR